MYLRLIFKLIIYVNFKLYVYEYINICSHIYIYIYIYIFVYINIGNPKQYTNINRYQNILTPSQSEVASEMVNSLDIYIHENYILNLYL